MWNKPQPDSGFLDPKNGPSDHPVTPVMDHSVVTFLLLPRARCRPHWQLGTPHGGFVRWETHRTSWVILVRICLSIRGYSQHIPQRAGRIHGRINNQPLSQIQVVRSDTHNEMTWQMSRQTLGKDNGKLWMMGIKSQGLVSNWDGYMMLYVYYSTFANTYPVQRGLMGQ